MCFWDYPIDYIYLSYYIIVTHLVYFKDNSILCGGRAPGDLYRMGRGLKTIFGKKDRDGDEILFVKLSRAGMENALSTPPSPRYKYYICYI